jgi:hypothetical protein
MSYRDDFRDVQRETNWTMRHIIPTVLLGILLLFGIGFLVTGADLASFAFWAPKYENVRRATFENTQSYVHGKTDFLNQMRFEYESTKDPDQKAALRRRILTEAGTIDNEKLPEDLQSFIRSVK